MKRDWPLPLAVIVLAFSTLTGCEHFSSLDRSVSSLPQMSFETTAIPSRGTSLAPSLDGGASSSNGCSACAH